MSVLMHRSELYMVLERAERRCTNLRLFGIVEDPVSPPPVNATRLCGAVLDRVSSLSQAQQAPGSVSLPEVIAQLR